MKILDIQKSIENSVHTSVWVCALCPTLYDPVDHRPARLLCPWDSPGRNTGVGCLASPPREASVYLSLKRSQMITAELKSILDISSSPPKVTPLLIVVLISPTHICFFWLHLCVSVNNVDRSFAGFNISSRWHLMRFFCSLCCCCCSALCVFDLSTLVYVSYLIRFCHLVNSANLIIHSPTEGHLGGFSLFLLQTVLQWISLDMFLGVWE